MSTCKHTLVDLPLIQKRVDYKHDLSLPISITPRVKKHANLLELDDYHNAHLLREREVHGKRTVFKISFEVYGRKSSTNMNFQRLRNRALLLNLPSADQAELVMRTIESVVEAMDGKLLVKG
jgi:hypothetical protein